MKLAGAEHIKIASVSKYSAIKIITTIIFFLTDLSTKMTRHTKFCTCSHRLTSPCAKILTLKSTRAGKC
jgi:hypothetical protein